MLSELIDVIFKKCTLRYGRDFTGRWEGLDLRDVKEDWAHELKGIKPETVAHGLKNLPDKPPTVKDFINACKGAPEIVLQRLDPPKANPEVMRVALEKLKQYTNKS